MSPLLTRLPLSNRPLASRSSSSWNVVCLISVISGNDPSLIRFLPARSRISCLGEGGDAGESREGVQDCVKRRARFGPGPVYGILIVAFRFFAFLHFFFSFTYFFPSPCFLFFFFFRSATARRLDVYAFSGNLGDTGCTRCVQVNI